MKVILLVVACCAFAMSGLGWVTNHHAEATLFALWGIGWTLFAVIAAIDARK